MVSYFIVKAEGRRRIKRDVEEQEDEEEVEDLENSYAFGGTLDDVERSALSPAMRHMCEGKPIQWLYQVHDHASVHSPGKPSAKPGESNNIEVGTSFHLKRLNDEYCGIDQVIYQLFKRPG